MAQGKDPLENLILDADEVDRATLAGALKDLIGVDSRSGGIVLKPGFNKLKPREKVLAYLLGRKVAVLLGRGDTEAAGFSTIQAEIGVPKGTAGPTLRELFKDRMVSQTDSKDYYVGPQQLNGAIEELKKGAGDGRR